MSREKGKKISVEHEESLDLREVFERYTYYWKWFLLSLFSFITVTFLSLRYVNPIFSSNGTILIKDESRGGSVSDLAVFNDLGLFGTPGNVDNEIEILKSRKILTQVVNNLELNKKYELRGTKTGLKSKELYTKTPVVINHAIHDSLLYNKRSKFKIIIIDSETVELLELEKEDYGKIRYGEIIETSIGPITINKTNKFNHNYYGRYIDVTISRVIGTITQIKKKLKIESVYQYGFILSLNIVGPSIIKNNAIINELIRLHELDKLNDNNKIAKNTSEFINLRMDLVSKELSVLDNESLRFKKNNHLIDVNYDAKLVQTKGTEIEKKIIEAKIQLELVQYMDEFIQSHEGIENLLPSNLGFKDVSIGELIALYNSLVLERNHMLIGSSPNNPPVLKLEGQIISIKNSLVNSLNNLVSVSNLELNGLIEKAKVYESELALVPGYEKDFRDIYRQQKIKETLYLYLMEKREENEIALVATIANTKVIDNAYCDGLPISPNKLRFYFVAIFLGIFIPAGIIFFRSLIDNKVHSKKDIEKFNFPYLGNIPFNDLEDKLVVLNNPRSVLSEAFRILRTNISFLFPDYKDKGNTILVTSTIASEGKTFVSLNLAHTLALTGKKTVVVGLDLRAPKLLEYLELKTKTSGVTDYIVNNKLSHSDISFQVEGVENLFIIPSGSVPPNPSELLMKPKLQELIELLKIEYDYIIFDTPPVSLVSDTLIISKMADISLYVIRANKLDKRMLEVPSKIYEENKINNMAVIINGITSKGGGYGYGNYGYGYGYGEDSKNENKKYQFWKKRKE